LVAAGCYGRSGFQGRRKSMNLLIPENELIVNETLLTQVTQKNPTVGWSGMEWGVKEAYARHAALLDRDLRLQLGFADLSESIVFYNAYYWALVFEKRYKALYSFDAGIEQWCFKVLESAPPDVDWQMVAYVVQTADRV
jgi:hypothetical protein